MTGRQADSTNAVVELVGVTKTYDRDPRAGQWRSLLPWSSLQPRQPLRALDAVGLTVARGEKLGLIGANGAGKSTLLKVVAGVIEPTEGHVRVQGTVGAMIELGIGFHPEMNGWENLRCSGVLRGRRRSDLRHILPEIARFAGVEDAMSSPLKKFSTGMKARLGFALATQFPVDVLAIDEVLAVGDPDFQDKCFTRIDEMVSHGTTLLFVSHEMRMVSMLCSRVVCLDDGQIVDDGPPTDVVERYLGESTLDEPMAHPSASISTFVMPASLAAEDRLTIQAEIDVVRPIRRPVLALEMTLPFLNPDILHKVSLERLPPITEAGTYRLHLEADNPPVRNTPMRLFLLVRDGPQIVSRATAECRLASDSHRHSYVAMDLDWRLEEVAPDAPSDHRRVTASGPAVIRARAATKTYRAGRSTAAVRALVPGRWGALGGELHALDAVDLTVGRGESLGIIGPNGAGKSTFLRLVAGLTRPDHGSISVDGRVVAMLDVGAGMHPDLTGAENLRVQARLLGLTRPQSRSTEGAMVEFAGLGAAIDVPVRQYSTGMRARLGFAVAILADGDVYLIDELLSVGDASFRRKAMEAILMERNRGASVLFVSHQLDMVEQLCSRVAQLESGRLVDDGPAEEVLHRYGGIVSQWAGGIHDATGGIRVLALRVEEPHLPLGGMMRLSGELIVEKPSSTASIELSYRAEPDDRTIELTRADRLIRTFYLRTLEAPGGRLTSAGTYRFELTLGPQPVSGRFDVVVAVVDDREGIVLSEGWQTVVVGRAHPNGMPSPVLEVAWRHERVPPRDNDPA